VTQCHAIFLQIKLLQIMLQIQIIHWWGYLVVLKMWGNMSGITLSATDHHKLMHQHR